MNRFWAAPLLAIAMTVVAPARAQESVPPIPIGDNHAKRLQLTSQVLDLIAADILAEVSFEEVSTNRVAGIVVRTSSGTSSGTVTITWQNYNQAITLFLDADHPVVAFEMIGSPPRRSPLARQRD